MASLRTLLAAVQARVSFQGRRWSLTIFGVSIAVLLALVLTLRFDGDVAVAVGQPSPRTFNAPRDLAYESTVATEAARREAANDPANLVYRESLQIHQTQRDQLQAIFESISSIRNNPSLSPDEQRIQLTELPSISIEPALAETLLALDDEEWQTTINQANALYDRTLRAYDYSIDEEQLADIKRGYLPYNVPSRLSENQRRAVLYFVETLLQANRILDEDATRQRQNDARAAVAPVFVTLIKGKNIVRQGDLITIEQYEQLVKLGLVKPSLDISAIAGRSLLAILTALGLVMFIWLYRRPLASRPRALIVLAGMLLIPVLVGNIFLDLWTNYPETFVLGLVGITLAILFGGGIALVVCVLVSLLLGFMGENDLQLAMISLAGAVAGIFAIRRADRATQFLFAGFATALAVFVTGMIWRLTSQIALSWEGTLTTLTFAGINGSIAGVMALGIHNILGRAASVITPTQLLELAHPNQPLLRRLMQEAPGTYHHSIVVSNLAENAAERIGADTLLTRVGAYYHDVGKMLRPYFFTDNQYDRSNVHDDLDPKTSARIITEHVTEGAKLARQMHIPEQIVAFILEHHGLDVVKYFYQQALQQDDNANIDDYRYPGPRPQSKETAILMLADGVEATVRSREQAGMLISERELEGLEEAPRGAQTIGQVVDQIINARLASGQLDESPLTLRDIQTIRQSFTKTLQGIYHPRVEYPKSAER